MRRKGLLIIFFLGIAGIVAFVGLDKLAARLQFNSAGDLIKSAVTNAANASIDEVPTLELTINEDDFGHIKSKRNEAIERGFLFNEDDSYVPVSVKFGKESATGEIRLKGHMLDHLEGEKWSYRIKLKDSTIDGMRRFSIQHPGTRNYVHEWLFHEMLKGENIIALNYRFVPVRINGEDYGIYAIEEHFAHELLAKNARSKGAILRFNPNLYWTRREARDLNNLKIEERYSRFQGAFIEPYDRGTVKEDSVLMNNFLEAEMRLERFRRGELTTQEVFDVEKLAVYHAILDLVGGYHSLDWSDVKYYLNPQNGKIEPVGYESFGVREAETLSGTNNYRPDKKRYTTLHQTMFSDTSFFKAYVRALNRVATKHFLDSVFESTKEGRISQESILHTEFPIREINYSQYYDNCKLIEHHFSPPRGFHGYIQNFSKDSATFTLGIINTLPVKVTGMRIDGKVYDTKSLILPCKQPGEFYGYQEYSTAIEEKVFKALKKGKNLELRWQILGHDAVRFTEVHERIAPDIQTASNQSDSLIYLPTGKVVFTDNVDFGEAELIASPGTIIYLKDSGSISCKSFKLKGDETNKVRLEAAEGYVGSGILVSGGFLQLRYVNVSTKGKTPLLIASKTNTHVYGSNITAEFPVMTVEESKLTIKETLLEGGNPLSAANCQVDIQSLSGPAETTATLAYSSIRMDATGNRIPTLRLEGGDCFGRGADKLTLIGYVERH